LVLGQVKINENITKKLMSNDKMLENINSQIKKLSSIATSIPTFYSRKILGQPETSLKSIKIVG